MNKMIIAIFIILILCLFGIAFIGYKAVTTPKIDLESLKKDNKRLQEQNDSIQEKLNLIDKTVYKTRTLIIKMQSKDSLLARDFKKIQGSFDKLNDNELKDKINTEFTNSIGNKQSTTRSTTSDNNK